MAKRRKRTLSAARKSEDKSSPAAGPPRDYAALSVSMLLFTATCLLFGRSLGNHFVNIGDDVYLTANRHLRDGFSGPNLTWAFTTYDAGLWHPLTWLSHLLDYQMFADPELGFHPKYAHLVNVLFHAGSVVLLFLTLKRMTGELGRSACVAAFFALHPLRVEAVVWAAERKDVLSTFFGMAALFAYTGYARTPGVGRYLAVLALFALSLLAQPMLVTLPFVLLLLDYWPLDRLTDRATVRKVVLEKVPLLALSTGAAVLAWLAQAAASPSTEEWLFPTRLGAALVSINTYLAKTVVPFHLSPVYSDPGANLSAWAVIGAAVLLAGMSYLLLWRGRREPYLTVGWLWFLGTLVPVLGLVPLGPHAVADRYTYFPQVGLLLMVVWGLADLADARNQEGVASLAAIVLLIAATVVSWFQVGYWQDSESLWRHALEVEETPANRYRLADTLARSRDPARLGEAADLYRINLKADPRDRRSRLSLANLLARQGKQADALKEYEAALELEPENVELQIAVATLLAGSGDADGALAHFRRVAELEPKNGLVRYRIGNMLFTQRNLAEAETELQAATALSPKYAPAFMDLGRVQFQLGKPAEAQKSLETAVRLQPADILPRAALGLVLEELGKTQEADSQYRESLRINPQWPQRFGQQAWVWSTNPEAKLRNGAGALELAQLANRATKHNDARLMDILAAAFAETKRFEDARSAARRALQLATTPPPKDNPGNPMQREALIRGIEERLGLYEKDQPFREASGQ